jgi:iron complex outermembrane receptor protein
VKKAGVLVPAMQDRTHAMKSTTQTGGRVKHVPVSFSLRPLAAALAAFGLQPLGALAQETATESVRAAPVVVTPTRVEQSAFDLPTAVTAVEAETIQEGRQSVNISETLVRAPGTVVQNRETYAQEQQIIIRGFGARSTFGVRGVKIIADGIPASTPDGQGGTAVFDLESAKRIEVLRGPFSALYGNHSGGVVQLFTEDGPNRPTVTARGFVGSYDSRKSALKFGGQQGDLNYIASVSRFDTDGYRDHSSARKDQFNAKLKVDMGTDSSLALVANYLNLPDNQDPLGLDATQLAQNRQQAGTNALAFNTRRSLDNLQTGAVYQLPVSSQDMLRFLAYVGQRSNEQFQAIPTANQDPVTSSGAVSTIDRDFGGLGLRWTRQGEMLSRAITLTVGGDYDIAIDDRKGYRNDLGVQGALKRDEKNTVDSKGAYAQAEWKFSDAWAVSAGVRYTRVDFESEDKFICTTTVNTTGTALGTCSGSPNPVTVTSFNPDDSGSASHAAWTPVAGVTHKLSPATNIYANAGKSFETPTFIELAYRSDGSSGLNLALEPSVSYHYEVGVKSIIFEETFVEAALFFIDSDKEIVVDTSSGGRQTFKNAGKTQRRGAELSVNAVFPLGFTGYLAATYLDATFEESFCSGSTTVPCPTANLVGAGNRIPAVPRYTTYADLSWRYPKWGLSVGLEGRWHGNVAVNDRNTAFTDSYFVAHFRASLEQQARGWRLTEFVRVDNVFDEEYVGAIGVNDANSRFYFPAPERNFLVGVSVSYAFGSD